MSFEERRKRNARRRLVQDLADALSAEESMIEVVMWAWERCDRFPAQPQEDPTMYEHSLEFTKMHQDYRELYEKKAAKFLENQEISMDDFLQDVRQFLEDEDDDATKGLLDALTASEDYLKFCKFMQQVHQRREWAEGMGFGGELGGNPLGEQDVDETTVGAVASPGGPDATPQVWEPYQPRAPSVPVGEVR